MSDSQNKKKGHVLVTGGAGYIGSSLVPLLIQKGYIVTVFDLFNFGVESLLSCTFSPNLRIVKGDIRDVPALKAVMEPANVIIHLAAIVGYPACAEDEQLAISTNTQGTKNVTDNLRKDQKLIYASTGSCYGSVESGFCTEETPLAPISLYGITKADAEKLTIEANGVSLRLATLFGVSQRTRLDLLINNLVFEALRESAFEVYEAHFKRTFLHVRDVARAFCFAIDHYDKMKGQAFNVGGDSMNCSKMDICNTIKKFITNTRITATEQGCDVDKRNYQVSYDKIRKLGFEPKITIDSGIEELIKVFPYMSPAYLQTTKNV